MDPTEAAGNSSDTPSTDSTTELGANPFEETYNAKITPIEPQSEASQDATADAGESDETGDESSSGTTVDSQGSDREDDSFLSEEEKANFDTESEAYKRMQASFTRKMQALSERERLLASREDDLSRRLENIERKLDDTQGEQPDDAIQLDKIELPPIPDLDEDLDQAITNRITLFAKQLIQQLDSRAQQQIASQEQEKIRESYSQQLVELKKDPAFAEMEPHLPRLKEYLGKMGEMASRPDALSIAFGYLKRDLGVETPAPQTDDSYQQGYQAALKKLQGKRASTVPRTSQPSPTSKRATPKAENLNDAVAQAFREAVATQTT